MDQIEQCDTGVVTLAVRERLIHCARDESRAILWADSRRRIKEFPGLIIKPNQFEIVGIEDPAPDDEVDLETLQAAADQLRTGNQAPVVITCGRRGMLVSDPAWTLVPGIEVTGEIDPTGAGDSVTAGTVLALCAGASLPEAALDRKSGCLNHDPTVGDHRRSPSGTARSAIGSLCMKLALADASRG